MNYNLSIFQQLFAHYFYVETEVKKVTRNFSCITVNVHRSLPSIFDRNESILRGGAIGPREYHYEIDGREYTGKIKSYVEKFFRCKHATQKVYYFPLFPEWSVVENQIPNRQYMNNFFISTAKLLSLLLAYAVFLVFRSKQKA